MVSLFRVHLSSKDLYSRRAKTYLVGKEECFHLLVHDRKKAFIISEMMTIYYTNDKIFLSNGPIFLETIHTLLVLLSIYSSK